MVTVDDEVLVVVDGDPVIVVDDDVEDDVVAVLDDEVVVVVDDEVVIVVVVVTIDADEDPAGSVASPSEHAVMATTTPTDSTLRRAVARRVIR